MGCDCGCGGECPMCSYILNRDMPSRIVAIKEAAESAGIETLIDVKKTRKEKKERKEN